MFSPVTMAEICPIQTPEGQNVGIITHLAALAELIIWDFWKLLILRLKREGLLMRFIILMATKKNIILHQLLHLVIHKWQNYGVKSRGAD